MKALSIRTLLVVATCCWAVLFTSCTKDELVEPAYSCSSENEKAASNVEEDLSGIASFSNGGSTSDPDDSGISDDGDDLSGSERNRKKRGS